MSMLKTTVSSQVFIVNKIFAINMFGGIESNDELIEKCEKLSKTRKLSKSQKLAKLGKKSLKNGNSPNFGAKKNKLNFLTSNARTSFNHLWLTFTKALIL